MLRLFNPCQPCCTELCKYDVKATMDWSGNEDFDLYGVVVDGSSGDIVYYDNMSADGLTLNIDAHPACAGTPLAPEVIDGSFQEGHVFNFWYNQHSNCLADATPSVVNAHIINKGTNDIYISVPIGVPTTGVYFTVVHPGEFFNKNPTDKGYNTGDLSGIDLRRIAVNNIIVDCFDDCYYYFIMARKTSDHILYIKDLETDEVCWEGNPITTNCWLDISEDYIISRMLSTKHEFRVWFSSRTNTSISPAGSLVPAIWLVNLGTKFVYVDVRYTGVSAKNGIGIPGTASDMYMVFVSGTGTKESYTDGRPLTFQCSINCCINESVDTLYLYRQEYNSSEVLINDDVIELTRDGDVFTNVTLGYTFTCNDYRSTSYLNGPGFGYSYGVVDTTVGDHLPNWLTHGLLDFCEFCNPTAPWWAYDFVSTHKRGYIISQYDDSIIECNCQIPINKTLYLTINNVCSNGFDFSGEILQLDIGVISRILSTVTTSNVIINGAFIWSGTHAFTRSTVISGTPTDVDYTINASLVSRVTEPGGWYIVLNLAVHYPNPFFPGLFITASCESELDYTSSTISVNCDPFEVEANLYMNLCTSAGPCQGDIVNLTITE